MQSHRLDLQAWKVWLQQRGNLTEAKSTQNWVDAYYDALKQRYKPRSVSRHLSSVKLFCQFLVEQGIWRCNPMALTEFPKVQAEPPTILSPQEVESLLNAPQRSHYQGLRDRVMLELACSSGLKTNELVGLDKADLFLDLGFVKIRGRRERMVPLTSSAIGLMREYLEHLESSAARQNEHCLFPNRNGERMTRIGFWNMVRKHALAAGIQTSINPTILRHSFAGHLLEQGLNLDQLQQLFGFRDLSATQQYAHINAPKSPRTPVVRVTADGQEAIE